MISNHVKNKVTNGPKKLYQLYHRMQTFSDFQIYDIVSKVVEKNAYFVHPQNILQVVLPDEDGTVQKHIVGKLFLSKRLMLIKLAQMLKFIIL